MIRPGRRPTDWLRAGEAAGLLIGAWLALAVLPVRVVFRFLCLTMGPAPDTRAEVETMPAAHQIGLAVERAARRLPIRTRCLHHALAGALMLRRRHLPATVVLGVRSRDGHLKAHAWLLSDGAPVLGVGRAPSFVPLAAFRGEIG